MRWFHVLAFASLAGAAPVASAYPVPFAFFKGTSSSPLASGPNFASSATQGSTANWDWLTPTFAFQTDGNYVRGTGSASNNSEDLDLTAFNLNVPPGATILGIETTIIGFDFDPGNGGKCIPLGVRLIKGGVVQTATNYGGTPRFSYTAPSTHVMGSSTDLWGNTWTPASVNASNFGVSIYVEADNANSDLCGIDSVAVKVYYAP